MPYYPKKKQSPQLTTGAMQLVMMAEEEWGPSEPDPLTQLHTHIQRYYWHPEDFLTEILGLILCDHTDSPGTLTGCQSILTVLFQREAALNGWTVKEQAAIRPDLPPWLPGETPPVYVCLGGGTSVGKTEVLLAGMCAWYLWTRWSVDDAWAGRIIFTGAENSRQQVKDSVWTRFRDHFQTAEDHFDKVDNFSCSPFGQLYALNTMQWMRTDKHRAFYLTASGKQSTQGLHGIHQFIVVDEAEGSPREFLDNLATAVEQDGRCSVVVLAANPETEESAFHRIFHSRLSISHTFDALTHPNVSGEPVRVWRDGAAVMDHVKVPGAISRAYVNGRIDDRWIEAVSGPDRRRHRFQLPWVEGWWEPRVPEWFSKVRGIVPPFAGTGTVCSGQVLDEALARSEPAEFDPAWATIGLDMCGEGDDEGVGWCNWGGGHFWPFWRDGRGDEDRAYDAVRAQCLELRQQGVMTIEVRYDAGGSLGRTLRKRLEQDPDLMGWVKIIPIHNNSAPEDAKGYHHAIDEAYWKTVAYLDGAVLHECPHRLRAGLTGRRIKYPAPTVKGVDVLALEPKKRFVERAGFSPDDADALAYCGPRMGWKIAQATARILA